MEMKQNIYKNKWFVLASVGMGIFLATVDGSIVNIALPTLTQAFQTDFATVQWVVLGYLLTVTTLMLSIGRLADMVGKKKIYTAGFVVFTLGSLLCGISSNVYMLIAARFVQAIGASMIMALGMAIITEAFPPKERGMALGFSGTIVSIGTVVGPTLGGLILNSLSWHWIFFVNLPVGVIGTLMVMRFVPSVRPEGKQRFDIWGAITLLISILSLLIALTMGQRLGFTSQVTLILAGTFLVFLVIFIVLEKRVLQPMIDLQLFRNRLFSINLITGYLSFLCSSGTFMLMPFFLENVLKYEPQQAGLLMAVVPLGIGVIAPLAGTLSDRVGTRPMAVIGLAISLFGYVLVSTLNSQTTTLGYILRFLPIGLGLGFFQSPNNSAIMGTAPKERMGIVSGMLAITRTLGQTTGVAVWGAFWASRTFAYLGNVLSEGATSAPAAMQIAGLQDTFHAIIAVIGFALLLAAWALVEERVFKTSAAINPASFPYKPHNEGD